VRRQQSRTSHRSAGGLRFSYLQGIDNAKIIATVHGRKTPLMPARTRLRI
jgi:hypothetical protein